MLRSLIKLNQAYSSITTATARRMSQPITNTTTIPAPAAPATANGQGNNKQPRSRVKPDPRRTEEDWNAPKQSAAQSGGFMYSSSQPNTSLATPNPRNGGVKRVTNGGPKSTPPAAAPPHPVQLRPSKNAVAGEAKRPSVIPGIKNESKINIDGGNQTAPPVEKKKKKRKPRNPKPIVEAALSAAPRREKKAPEESDGSSSVDEDRTELFRQVVSKEEDVKELGSQIRRLYEAQRASPEALEARWILIDRLTDLLNQERWKWGHEHDGHRYPLVIEAFGSVRFGLATCFSDLDLCICDPYRPQGQEMSSMVRTKDPNAPTLPEIYNMRELGLRLKRAGIQKVAPVPFAGVPIVKFEAIIGVGDEDFTIQADLNTNERFGVFNSQLLDAYCNIREDVRPLCVFIKFWAKQRRLNDPSGSSGTVSLSSYTLILLVISYLQHIAYLPNLQDPQLIAQSNTARQVFYTKPRKQLGRKSRGHKSKAVCWDVTFAKSVPKESNWRGQVVSLKDLAKGFFNYYGNEFKSEQKVVSISAGAPFSRHQPFKDFTDFELNVDVPANDSGGLSLEESRRQREEDEALAAMAEEDALDLLGRPLEVETVENGQIEGFVEPESWSQRLIVQDPFLLTRNTALNITPDVVDHIFSEMRRAVALMDTPGSTVESICNSAHDDAAYLAIKASKKMERSRRRKIVEGEAKRLDKSLVKSASGSSSQVETEVTGDVNAEGSPTDGLSEMEREMQKLNL